MALHLDPGGHEPLRADDKVRAADVRPEWRLARNGVERLAHGALVCPACEAPVVIDAPVGAGSRLACGFCGHAARAREFLLADVFDTVANEAYLIARVG